MIKTITRKRFASLAVFLLGMLLVLYYIIVKERVEFDSDFTDTILWAEAMLTGNGLFDKTMNYAYTLPFGGSMLMAPFVAIWGVGYKAHVLGFVLFFGIFTFASYKLFRAMDFSIDASLVCTGTVLLLSLPTKNTRMIMWGHVIHYSLGLLFVIIAISVFSKIDFNEINLGHNFYKIFGSSKEHFPSDNSTFTFSKENIVWLCILAILSALFCSNGLSTILFFAIPFWGAVIIERYIDLKDKLFCKKNIDTLVATVICVISGGLGFVVSKIMQRGVNTVYDGMFKDIQSWQTWVWEFEERIRDFLVLTAGEIETSIAMDSLTGIRILVMCLFGFMVLVLPILAIVSYKEMSNVAMRTFFISYYILLVSSLFVYDFSSARGTPHRLVGLYMTAVFCTVIYMAWLIKSIKYARFGTIITIVISIASLFSSYSVMALRGENRFDALARVLEENELEHGYAEYWSAQVTTVLSDSKVVVCPVNIDQDGNISPRYYNIRSWQFDDTEGVDRYFLFLSAWEYDAIKDKVGAEAVETIGFDEDGYILVFDHNIF